MERWEIGPIDLVIVDLYPFEDTVASGADHPSVIEKIDIGGISLIRAAAKNYKDVLVVPDRSLYPQLLELLRAQNGHTTLSDRMFFAAHAFKVSSHYDTAIFQYMNRDIGIPAFSHNMLENAVSCATEKIRIRIAMYFGAADSLPRQLHGKDISYNNLLDIEAALRLIGDFTDPALAIMKHNNACGCATGKDLKQLWERALMADPTSAFGGIIVTNRPLTADVAQLMNHLFFEVVQVAPSYDPKALEILKGKKNRIILVTNTATPSRKKNSAHC